MKYVFYFFIFIISSCQSKNNASNNNEISDTSQLVSPLIDSPNPPETDSSFSISKSPNDTIILGFRIGMSHSEFEKHKQALLQKKKLKILGKGLVYQIKIDENELDPFPNSPELDIPPKIWVGNGVVIPEFFEDRLMSIKIEFVDTRGNIVYNFFAPTLNMKYYKSTTELYNIYDQDKKFEALEVGNSFNAYESNNWSIGDVNISLRYSYEVLKVTDKKAKTTNNVILKYWSEYYYNQKQVQKSNKESKEENEVENDL